MNEMVQIDSRDVDHILGTLSDHDTVDSIIYEGLEAMSWEYYNAVLESLRKEMGEAADRPNEKGYILSRGIGIHQDRANTTIGVHALKDYRLKWFEEGTRPRYTKGKKTGEGYYWGNRKIYKRDGNGAYRGFLTANHFFTKGISATQAAAEEALKTAIINAIRDKGIDVTP